MSYYGIKCIVLGVQYMNLWHIDVLQTVEQRDEPYIMMGKAHTSEST